MLCVFYVRWEVMGMEKHVGEEEGALDGVTAITREEIIKGGGWMAG